MSEAIKAYESLEKNNIMFEPGPSNYTFRITPTPLVISKKDEYISIVKKIAEENNLTICESDDESDGHKLPCVFKSNGKIALTIGAKSTDEPFDDPVKISKFTIPRTYERAKELADYLIKKLSSKQKT